jgi:uncharacterized membrane protein YqiK
MDVVIDHWRLVLDIVSAVLFLALYRVWLWLCGVHIVPDEDQVGVVMTREGSSLDVGEIAGPTVAGHNLFQNPQAFVDAGGSKGLQEQVLLAGRYFINPRFATVELASMVEVPQAKKINAEADANVLRAVGEAQAAKTRAVGAAEAEVIRLKIESMEAGNYAVVQVAESLSKSGSKLVPDIVAGTGAQGGTLVDVLLAGLIRDGLPSKATARFSAPV